MRALCFMAETWLVMYLLGKLPFGVQQWILDSINSQWLLPSPTPPCPLATHWGREHAEPRSEHAGCFILCRVCQCWAVAYHCGSTLEWLGSFQKVWCSGITLTSPWTSLTSGKTPGNKNGDTSYPFFFFFSSGWKWPFLKQGLAFQFSSCVVLGRLL